MLQSGGVEMCRQKLSPAFTEANCANLDIHAMLLPCLPDQGVEGVQRQFLEYLVCLLLDAFVNILS